MEKVSIIGLDLAKRSFQAHGARADGGVGFRKKLSHEKVLAFLAEQSRCERVAVRHASSRPLVDALETYMREQLARLSRGHDLAKAINYMLKRWAAFTLFLDDGRVCMSPDGVEKRNLTPTLQI